MALRSGFFLVPVAPESESLLVLCLALVPILRVFSVVGHIDPAAVPESHLCGQSSREVDIPVAVYADRPALGRHRRRIAVRSVPDNEFHCRIDFRFDIRFSPRYLSSSYGYTLTGGFVSCGASGEEKGSGCLCTLVKAGGL